MTRIRKSVAGDALETVSFTGALQSSDETAVGTLGLEALGSIDWAGLEEAIHGGGDLYDNLSDYLGGGNASEWSRWGNESLDSGGGFQYSAWQIAVLATLAGVTSVITIGGNLIVILSFIVERTIRQPTNYFIASLAVSDLLIGSVSMPFYTVYLLAGQRWPLGEILCDLWLSVDYTVCLCSIYTVFCITIDRFCSVKIPARYRDWRTENKVLAMVAVTWAVPVLVFFTSIFGWQYFVGERTVPEGKCYVQYMDAALFNCLLQIGYFWITLTIMCVLYNGIYQVVLNLSRKSEEKQKKLTTMVTMVGSALKMRSVEDGGSGLSGRLPAPSRDEESPVVTSDEHEMSNSRKKTTARTESIILSSNSRRRDSKTGRKKKKKLNFCPQLSNGVKGKRKNRSLKTLDCLNADNDDDNRPGMVRSDIGVVVSEASDVLPPPNTGLLSSNSGAASIQRYDAINVSETPRICLSIAHCDSASSQSLSADSSAKANLTDANSSPSPPSWFSSSNTQNLQVPGQTPKSSSGSREELVPRISRKASSASNLQLPANRPPADSRKGSTASLSSRRFSHCSLNFRSARRQSFRIRGGGGEAKERHNTSSENRARKALRTITVILGAFVLCWTPWHVLSMVISYCPPDRVCVEPLLYDVSYWLCYLNSPINPLCYALANQQFKKTFIRIMKFDFRRS